MIKALLGRNGSLCRPLPINLLLCELCSCGPRTLRGAHFIADLLHLYSTLDIPSPILGFESVPPPVVRGWRFCTGLGAKMRLGTGACWPSPARWCLPTYQSLYSLL